MESPREGYAVRYVPINGRIVEEPVLAYIYACDACEFVGYRADVDRHPALPGCETVRDTENPTPQLVALPTPFELTAETLEPGQPSLFGR
jgi:hypothetical protein